MSNETVISGITSSFGSLVLGGNDKINPISGRGAILTDGIMGDASYTTKRDDLLEGEIEEAGRYVSGDYLLDQSDARGQHLSGWRRHAERQWLHDHG